MIPIKYNIRNLRVRWVTTLMTVLATALVVFASVLTFGLNDGLEHALKVGGDKLDLIVLRQGANNESSSGIEQSVARDISNLPGVLKDANGTPMSSSEYVTILAKPRRNKGGTTNLIVRGLDDVGRQLRPGFKITEGRDVRPGLNEAITSRRMGNRFENLAIGEKLELNKVDFTVVGYFEADGSAAESEVWSDIKDVTTAKRMPSAVSTVNLRGRDEAAVAELKRQLEQDDQFKLKVVSEEKYFEEQMSSSVIIKIVGYIIAGFLTFGAMFAAANTMYAAVSSRAREIGTLRAIGFPGSAIMMSFLFESVFLCLLGGLLGCLATLPLNGLSTGTANWATFSELTFAFRFGPNVLMRGVMMALIMGLLGGLLPAYQAIRLNIVDSLRKA